MYGNVKPEQSNSKQQNPSVIKKHISAQGRVKGLLIIAHMWIVYRRTASQGYQSQDLISSYNLLNKTVTPKIVKARSHSTVEGLLMVPWVIGLIPHGGPIEYF